MTLAHFTRASVSLRVTGGDTPARPGRCGDQEADLRARVHPEVMPGSHAALSPRARRPRLHTAAVWLYAGHRSPSSDRLALPLRPDHERPEPRLPRLRGSALTHPFRANLARTQIET